jgi:integrase
MPRAVEKLSVLAVAKLRQPGMYADGGGLYLQVTGADAKSWIFRFRQRGRAREMGLGSLQTVSLAAAREAAAACRRQLAAAVDPIEARHAQRAAAALEAARAVTFRQAAEAYIASHRSGWRNEKHAGQWESTLKTYVYPVFGSLPVQEVDVGLVMKSVEPIWKTKTETASRVRGRIESILDWAKSRGHRTGENPARWRGHLENLLPPKRKVRRVRHYPALPYVETGTFMTRLRGHGGTGAPALEFLILTAARSGEVRGARWSEIDIDQATWTVPEDRIKGEKEHRIPLSAPALAVLERMRLRHPLQKPGRDELVFPGARRGRPLSDMTLGAVLDRMGLGNITVHGFRSTFRDWAAEETNFSREVAEMALAHVVKDEVEAAYRRGVLFEKRRRLMNAWARYCAQPRGAGKLLPMRRASE